MGSIPVAGAIKTRSILTIDPIFFYPSESTCSKALLWNQVRIPAKRSRLARGLGLTRDFYFPAADSCLRVQKETIVIGGCPFLMSSQQTHSATLSQNKVRKIASLHLKIVINLLFLIKHIDRNRFLCYYRFI